VVLGTKHRLRGAILYGFSVANQTPGHSAQGCAFNRMRGAMFVPPDNCASHSAQTRADGRVSHGVTLRFSCRTRMEDRLSRAVVDSLGVAIEAPRSGAQSRTLDRMRAAMFAPPYNRTSHSAETCANCGVAHGVVLSSRGRRAGLGRAGGGDQN
jgi:hypothetical protein